MFKRNTTISECLASARDTFNDQFSEREKRQLMKQLLQNVLSSSVEDLIRMGNQKLSSENVALLKKMVQRVNDGIPFQLVVGSTFFYEHEFKVDERALIPRPETEELVHGVINLLRKHKTEPKVLDIGTGTGCIAISIKKAIPSATVTAIDVSEEALQLAKENAEQLGAGIDFIQSDILREEFSQKFDLIVSNPPYIPEQDRAEMQSNVLDYEPATALFVPNDDPILFYERIAAIGVRMLKKSGYLAFEIHENLADEIEKCLTLKGYKNIEIKTDLQGKDRMIFAQLTN